MGKETKGDRKATKPSSSARAAESLAGKAAAGVGFGFGGFMGATPVAATASPGFSVGGGAASGARRADGGTYPASSSAPGDGGGGKGDSDSSSCLGSLTGGGDVVVPTQLDGELAQCLRHLSKKDPTTKTKALQSLRALLPSRSGDHVAAALPAWIHCYRRLILDPSRAVRSEAAATLSAFVAAAGKATAPHLRALMGPWWLAQHDPYAEAAMQSRAAFSAAFPGSGSGSGSGSRRQLEVLLHCRSQLVAYLRDMMAAAPAQLGDPRKDSAEELEERHERVQAACCAAWAQLLDVLAGPGPATLTPLPQQPVTQRQHDEAGGSAAAAASTNKPATAAQESELLAAVQETLCKQGFWRAVTGSKSAVVRRAAYSLARTAATRAPWILASCIAESAPCVLGALGDKEPGNHGAMWEAVLTYGKYVPEGWSHVNLRKMLLPRLTALLRHGCYGSAASSLPALLPLLPLLPPGTLGPAPDVFGNLLDAVWTGAADPSAQSRAAKSASLAAYRECLAWGLSGSGRLSVAQPQAAAAANAASTPTSPPAAQSAEHQPPHQPSDVAFCTALLRGSVQQHVLPALLGQPGRCSSYTATEAAELLADLVQSLVPDKQQQRTQDAATASAGAGAGGGASTAAAARGVAVDCLSQLLQEYLAHTLASSVSMAASAETADSGAAPAGDRASSEMTAECDGVVCLLGRLRAAGSPACDQLATQVASAAAAGLMTSGSALPTEASQLLAALLREYGASGLATVALSPAPFGGGSSAAVGASGITTQVAPARALGSGRGGGTTAASPSLSLSLESLIAGFRDGPVSGAAAAASADLLVAFCLSRQDEGGEGGGGAVAGGGGAAAVLWEQVMAEVLMGAGSSRGDSGRQDTAGELQARCLRRATLLMQRCAASSTCYGGVCTWTSPSLDAAAVSLLAGAAGQPLDSAMAVGEAAPRVVAAAEAQAQAELLSTALGANSSGLVMLSPAAASSVLQVLTARLRAATVPAAAAIAVSALGAPICDPKCGLWGLLPGAACDVVAAVAALAWRAPLQLDPAAATGLEGDADDSEEGPDSPAADSDCEDADGWDEGASTSIGDWGMAGAREDRAALLARGLAAIGAEEDDEKEQADGMDREEWAGAWTAAAEVWRQCQPLSAAAAALPADVTDALVLRLARDLAAAVCGKQHQHQDMAVAPDAAASYRLGARAWAAHAADLLRCVPGGASRRSAALAALLAADPAWRFWSAAAAAAAAAAADGGDGRHDGDDGMPVQEPAAAAAAERGPPGGVVRSLEHLARLLLLLLEQKGRGVGGGEDSLGWVVLELLCSYTAAVEGQQGSSAVACTQSQAVSWRSAVGGAAEAGLQRLVAAAVLEAEAASRAGRHPGHSERQLHALVDGLAEGCSAAAAAAAAAQAGSGPSSRPPGSEAEAVYLECLCRVAVVMERASAAALARRLQRTPQESEPRGLLAPLLPHQQRLCRNWLAGCRPDTAAITTSTARCLPLRAISRLLPLVAGPLRLAAASRAAEGVGDAGDGRSQPSISTVAAAEAEAILVEAGLPELSEAWVRHCLAQPAAMHMRELRTELQPADTGADAGASGTLQSLRLAAACFPVPGACGGIGGGGAAAAADAAVLLRSGGAALAAPERPLLPALVRHLSERTAGVAAARRQQPLRPGATDALGQVPERRQEETQSLAAAAEQEAQACVTQMQHAALLYCWQGLGQPEWHALLQDVQVHMAAAVSALQDVLRQLAAAARAAADSVLGQAPGSTPPGPVALQLLHKLVQRGVLPKLPVAAQLAEACTAAVHGNGTGPAEKAAAQLAAALAEMQSDVFAARGSSTAAGAAASARELLGSSVSCCYSYAMQLALLAGGLTCFTAALGSCAAATTLSDWLTNHGVFWAAVARCAGHALQPGREHLGAVAAAAAVRASAGVLEGAGMDAVGALLALALAPAGGDSGSGVAAAPAPVLQLRPAAYRLLLLDGDAALLGRLTLAEAVATGAAAGGGAGSSGGDAADVLPEYEGDDLAYLTAGGVRPEMAQLLLLPATAAAASGGGCSVAYLTAWSLLLAHVLHMDPSSGGLAVLRQLLREAGHLVHGLLGQLVPQLGITGGAAAAGGGAGASKSARRLAAAAAGNPGTAARGSGAGAAHANAAATAVEGWQLAEVLREVGLPAGRHARRTCCRSLYRAVLRALPATARGWFGDLRDRGLAAAVEAYTAAAEGPALLAAEMEAVQALGKGVAASDGDSKFTVRCSAAAREVVAVLEVEDGAVLELAVRLPACLPLRAPEVECRRKVGVNEGRLRKWLLSIATFLRHQNGSVADAICLWRRNVDSEFAGVEACLICYSVISSVNAQLPRLVCRTCGVRFHPACLYKWFKSAGKSQCPHCQALW
ncbi:hypothetical protein HYH02_011259 [Chlamydomonas schloesseri]|uniref:E3 ubiquitin-protein ligase listerin n=1 Tax=Chlamydomonas schloesseri TaxID=2026947 RepID=A0A835W367_9CHLO|nr:hypothetical protein HYH02_011259 [Chlamydomonas schloesseri]|eukprot:KAG2437620.1 hypothetical protein HYH02_011259 [Chlamydomonas schloesseri]